MTIQGDLKPVVAAVEGGEPAAAHTLVFRLLENEPGNLEAWNWAFELATSRDERIHCLERILHLNPGDRDAQERLALLGVPGGLDPSRPSRALRQPGERVDGGSRSPMVFAALAARLILLISVVIVVAGAIYTLPRSSLLGLRGPDFDSLSITESFDEVVSDQFADSNIVETSVSNHRFRWYSQTALHPEGKINLLHTVPATVEVFR